MEQPLVQTLQSADPVLELEGTQFGDKRLTCRGVAIARAMRPSPGSSLPRLSASHAELAGMYRFFNNRHVTPDRLLNPHFTATARRASSLKECLVLHDTSEMRYGGSRLGLGRLSDSPANGYLAHLSLVTTADGRALPVGVIRLRLRTRPPRKTGKKKTSRRAKYRFGPDNEHSRWEEGVEAAERRLQGGPPAIHLMDREGDSYLLFVRMLEKRRRFVIRLNHNRVLAGTSGSRLFEAVADLPVLAERNVSLTARTAHGKAPAALRKHPPRVERLARLVITATTVHFQRPQAAPAELPESLELRVVRVHEPHPPPDGTPVEWLLVTTEPIESAAEAIRIVDLYRKRWTIEDLFKALKSGCSVQKREFENASALQNVLALSIPLAWHMLLLRSLAREEPTTPAQAVLTPTQLAVLQPASRKLPPRQRPPPTPTVREALLAIAALGGHLSNNGEPGWLTLARGFDFLLHLEMGYKIAISKPLRELEDV